jgi:acyl carrier protein
MLLAEPGTALRLTLIYDRQNVSRATVERWGRDLALLLERLPGFLERRVAELQALLSPPAAPGSRTKIRLSAQSQNFVPPQTELELSIAAVWQSMFGMERVGIEENFFELGGHSLLLVQMHSRLRETLKIEFPIVTLFEHPTIRSLAHHLSQSAISAPQTGEQWRDRAQRQKEALAKLRAALKR